MTAPISLRPIKPEDKAFLYRVYASTREDELAVVPWDEAEKQAFLTMQFTAQHTYYQEQFGQAQFQLVLLGDEPVGRLYLDRRADEIRIIDIALLAEHRRKGIGSHLLGKNASHPETNVSIDHSHLLHLGNGFSYQVDGEGTKQTDLQKTYFPTFCSQLVNRIAGSTCDGARSDQEQVCSFNPIGFD